jgi:uncharacterized membrane protein
MFKSSIIDAQIHAQGSQRAAHSTISCLSVTIRRVPPTTMKRHNIALMVLLTIVTAGIYYPLWFLLRRDDLNKLNATEKLGTVPFVLAAASFGIILVLNVVSSAAESAIAEVVSRLIQITVGILLLIQCFKVRRIVEAHLQESLQELSDQPHLKHAESALSGVAVFFLTIFYLQYVINNRIVSRAEIQST